MINKPTVCSLTFWDDLQYDVTFPDAAHKPELRCCPPAQ